MGGEHLQNFFQEMPGLGFADVANADCQQKTEDKRRRNIERADHFVRQSAFGDYADIGVVRPRIMEGAANFLGAGDGSQSSR